MFSETFVWRHLLETEYKWVKCQRRANTWGVWIVRIRVSSRYFKTLYQLSFYPDVRIMISKKPWSFLYPNCTATLADYSGYPWLLLVWGEIWNFAACWKPSYAYGPMAPTSTIKVYCRGEGTAELQRSYPSLSPNINPLLAIFSPFYSQSYKTESIRDYTADYFDVRECEG